MGDNRANVDPENMTSPSSNDVEGSGPSIGNTGGGGNRSTGARSVSSGVGDIPSLVVPESRRARLETGVVDLGLGLSKL